MTEAQQIIASIRKGKVSPIFFLSGEEPYFIDSISDFIEQNLLREEEKGFNQMIMYGRDATVEEIIANAKRFPMMADHQVIIVKEAQELSRSIENLTPYAENPQPTTVLVICYKYKKLDKRKKLYKALQQQGVVYENKKLYESQVSEWIRKEMQERNLKCAPKAAQMLVEFLGNDLGRIDNEIRKLQVVCPEGSTIGPEVIEENIGISKEFNNFELCNAIGGRESYRAHRIVQYFSQNPKDNPLVVTISLLFNFFIRVQQYHILKDKSKANAARALKVSPYFVGDYITAARNFPLKKVSQIISFLREADVRGKGVGAANVHQGDLLKELLVKIMA